jgi:hypothetical protein
MIIQPLDKQIPKLYEAASAATGAGLDASVTVPANRIWQFMHVYITLATDVTAVNRTMMLRLANDGGVQYGNWPAAFAQAASVTYRYNYIPGIGRSARAAAYTYNIEIMPDNILVLPGWVLSTAIQGLQAGDNVTGFRYMYREWVMPDF